MPPGKFQGSTRGIFGLKTWEIPRMPSGVKTMKPDSPLFIAKYPYEANRESPLGTELSLAPGDKLVYLGLHDNQPMWCQVQDKLGQIGYVPASYVVNFEELTKVKTMPWLNSKPEKTEEDDAVERRHYKKYVSSYKHEEFEQMKLKEFYCDLCGKQLNGPQPYRAHMLSKAHKEIEEYYKESEN